VAISGIICSAQGNNARMHVPHEVDYCFGTGGRGRVGGGPGEGGRLIMKGIIFEV
jgi:hypothetical protein